VHVFRGNVNITGDVTFDYPFTSKNTQAIETGSYTPTILYVSPPWFLMPLGSNTVLTFGRYRRIGNVVTVMFRVVFTAAYPASAADSSVGVVIPSFTLSLPAHLPRNGRVVAGSFQDGYMACENHMGVFTAGGSNSPETLLTNHCPALLVANDGPLITPEGNDRTVFEEIVDKGLEIFDSFVGFIPLVGTGLKAGLEAMAAAGYDISDLIPEGEDIPLLTYPRNTDQLSVRFKGTVMSLNIPAASFAGVYTYITSSF